MLKASLLQIVFKASEKFLGFSFKTQFKIEFLLPSSGSRKML